MRSYDGRCAHFGRSVCTVGVPADGHGRAARAAWLRLDVGVRVRRASLLCGPARVIAGGDIALWRFGAAADALSAALRERRGGETVAQVLRRWLDDECAYPDDDLKSMAVRMFAANPELNALRTARMAKVIDDGTAALAAETGLPADSPGLRLAAVAGAAMLLEITNLTSAAARRRATAEAIAFLEAGIRSLGTRDGEPVASQGA